MYTSFQRSQSTSGTSAACVVRNLFQAVQLGFLDWVMCNPLSLYELTMTGPVLLVSVIFEVDTHVSYTRTDSYCAVRVVCFSALRSGYATFSQGLQYIIISLANFGVYPTPLVCKHDTIHIPNNHTLLHQHFASCHQHSMKTVSNINHLWSGVSWPARGNTGLEGSECL